MNKELIAGKYFDLHNFFATTEYGKKLKAGIRFERYKPEFMTDEQWEKLLGRNVNNLDHTLMVFEVAKRFVEYEKNILQKDVELLFLAVISHEWGEVVVGDVTIDDKTNEGKEREREVLRRLGNELLEKYGDREMLKMFPNVVDGIFHNFSNYLGKAFDSTDRITHLQTGIDSWRISKGEISTDLYLRLQWLTNNVLLHQIPTLLGYAEEFSYIKKFLSDGAEIISEAFNELPKGSFDFYPDRTKREGEYFAAKDIWMSKHGDLLNVK